MLFRSALMSDVATSISVSAGSPEDHTSSTCQALAVDAIEITTRRVVLDDFVDQPGDLACVESASRDLEIVQVTTIPAEWSEAAGRAFVERQRSRRVDGIGWSLAVREPANRRAVGQIGLWIPELAKGRVEIGYWVAPSDRGHGHAAAALDALATWAFEHLDIARITLSIEPTNAGSIATARRAGFVDEALLRNWQYIDGTQIGRAHV